MKDAVIQVSARTTFYVIILGTIFFSVLTMFTYVNLTTHRSTEIICTVPKVE